MLQTRSGKRTGLAAVKLAVDMVKEKLITEEEALMRIDGDQLNQLLFPIFDPKAKAAAISDNRIVAKGMPAGPGAATGLVVFTADAAVKWAEEGKKVILARKETSPEDVSGMWAAQAILTSTGGMTSHAAVVARGWGKCCVVGCSDLDIDAAKKMITVGGRTINEGHEISIDGATGEVLSGHVDTSASPVISGIVDGNKTALKHPICQMFLEIMRWADKIRKINVRTNADSPQDSSNARALGAEGIGLCRTEHMFFEGDRIWAIREMILASDLQGREKALKLLLPLQRSDFEGIFEAMDGFPVTIRLLDPPLHEFLPHDTAGQTEMAKRLGVPVEVVRTKVSALHEFNPMLGHRGCRLSITYPEIGRMQVRAIMEAACNMVKKGIKVYPEIMIPLIGTKAEFDILAEITHEVAKQVIQEKGVKVNYLVGTMMEIPRATLIADQVAEKAEFFSFGTNDLTQMTFGFSRDDIGTFLPEYLGKKILLDDPFASIDQEGVGQLVKKGVEGGRSKRKNLKIGVCGEHGGDPDSVKFFADVGLDYVSCSPYRVPIARLAAAQAVIEAKNKGKKGKAKKAKVKSKVKKPVSKGRKRTT
jgi:pyruvate,orthophosphate dikinase